MKRGSLMQTKMIKWGNSQGILLPKCILDSVDIKDTDTVEVVTENNNIIIKKLENKKKHKTLQERFKNFDGIYEFEQVDWGTPEGKEIW